MKTKMKKRILYAIGVVLCINGLLPSVRNIKRVVMNKQEAIEIWMVQQYLEDKGYNSDYKTIERVCIEARNYDAITFTLMASLGVAESGFKPNEVSDKEAYGMFQITLSVAKPYFPNKSESQLKKMLLNPEVNTRIALKRLEYLSVEFNGNIGKTLTAYHAGTTRADNPPQETIKYLYKIMGIWNDILMQDWWYRIIILISQLGVILIISIVIVLVLRDKMINYLKKKRESKR